MDTYTHTYAYTCTYTYTYIYMHMHIYIYIYLYIHRICTSCSEREANVYADVHNICITFTSAHAWCSTTPVNACWLSAKMHTDLCMRAYTTVQQLPCHGSYYELILSLARTSCRLSFTTCPPAARPPAGNAARLKSVQIHASSWRGRRQGVAHASSDHPHWCRPHPVCLWVPLVLNHGGHFIKNSISTIFPHEFFKVVSVHKTSLASCQRCRHSVQPRALKCPFKQSDLSAWSRQNL